MTTTLDSPSQERKGRTLQLSPGMQAALRLVNPEAFALLERPPDTNGQVLDQKGSGLGRALKGEQRERALLLGMFYPLPSVNPSSSSWSSQGPRKSVYYCQPLVFPHSRSYIISAVLMIEMYGLL